MLQTTIVGYPRIGSQRELKFATEAYFKGQISGEELHTRAAALRAAHWQRQQRMGLCALPSGDFSLYDGVLDTAFMLGAVPQEYRDLGLNDLDTYFAMARGYQGPAGDARALAMRKWFNTNYHYMVPVLDADTKLRLANDRPFRMFAEAQALGIDTRPVLLGPLTFLKLADCTGSREDFTADIVHAYKQIFSRFNELNTEWIQLDEPILVTDLSEGDIALFRMIYDALLPAKGELNVLLQTYFGDIRDIYETVIAMEFDGIGLDFVEGKQTLALIRSHGFPRDKALFAGVISGRNIWRNNYEKTLALLRSLDAHTDRLVISTSCALLHVPYTLDNEIAMDDAHKRRFAFAHEKLRELEDLKQLLGDANYQNNEIYVRNTPLFDDHAFAGDALVRDKVAALKDDDFVRRPAFSAREKLQKEVLGLPPLPTTTIGSFPQTAEVKALRSALKKGEMTRDAYEAAIREKIAACIALQEDIGLDVLVHGEFERNDMVEYFGENLDGFLFTQKAWVQSYGTRCVKPPIICGDIRRAKPITTGYIAYAQSLTDRPVKGMLTGPVTILNWSFPREDVEAKVTAFQIALAIKEEVMALEEDGTRIIQIDEAALKEKLPLRRSDWHADYLDWAIPAFRLVHAAVRPETQIHTHMCYSEFDDIIEDIDAMDADVISFEAARSNLSIVDTLGRAGFRTQVGPGVYDIHSPRVPGVDEIVQAVEQMLKKIPKEKLWVNPDCGLKTRGETETNMSLKNLVAAVKKVREIL